VSNAVTSIEGIINAYGLDGVDVNYEHFAPGADVDTFVECVGRLLTQLKQRMPLWENRSRACALGPAD
jgi:chitinase